jgi:hypothetical protein
MNESNFDNAPPTNSLLHPKWSTATKPTYKDFQNAQRRITCCL